MRVCEFGEQRILALIFYGFGVERGGFVDIGAGGPYSNTDWLAEAGWSGVQVDFGVAEWPAFENVHVLRGYRSTAQNVGELLNAAERVDFLSIDVDGMDYWLMKAALESGARPVAICVEFNQSKIAEDDVQPYDPCFEWPGGTTFGCSWRALNALAERHGYMLAFKNLVNCIFAPNDARTLKALFPRADQQLIVRPQDHKTEFM
jgi:hypothetical protein